MPDRHWVSAIDIGNTICKNIVLHYFTISHFGDLSRFLPQVERTVFLPTEMLLSLTVVFIVEVFFASRVYLLKTTHWSIPSVIGVSAAVAYAFGLGKLNSTSTTSLGLKRNAVVCANEYKNPWITFDRPSQINFGLTVAFSALSDIIATVAIWWSCRRSTTGFKKTNSIVNKLVEYVVTRGMLVTLFQVVYLVVFLAKTTSLEWTVFQIVMSKVYVITMVAMLNRRKSMHARDNGVITVSVIEFSDLAIIGDISRNSIGNTLENHQGGPETKESV
ncbi:hypothetical protein Moror_5073 [Moniliophthora roreri MCA 2997]|uniref:DUF6534 domain-containing protein n=1 Tax=Moniliophthora roreri (strain MCA 2997) TaxID=1381753 RepID=V2Y3V5_MONRO|nr:hypothetical protein Moror_5073 [Moniliophthora roreri MCA 2997]